MTSLSNDRACPQIVLSDQSEIIRKVAIYRDLLSARDEARRQAEEPGSVSDRWRWLQARRLAARRVDEAEAGLIESILGQFYTNGGIGERFYCFSSTNVDGVSYCVRETSGRKRLTMAPLDEAIVVRPRIEPVDDLDAV